MTATGTGTASHDHPASLCSSSRRHGVLTFQQPPKHGRKFAHDEFSVGTLVIHEAVGQFRLAALDRLPGKEHRDCAEDGGVNDALVRGREGVESMEESSCPGAANHHQRRWDDEWKHRADEQQSRPCPYDEVPVLAGSCLYTYSCLRKYRNPKTP